MALRKPRDPAWMPPAYSVAEIEALKAMARGEAQPHQQKMALDWLINTAAGTYDLSYRSDAEGGERETAFAEGRRFVGMQAVKLVNLPPALVAKLRSENG